MSSLPREIRIKNFEKEKKIAFENNMRAFLYDNVTFDSQSVSFTERTEQPNDVFNLFSERTVLQKKKHNKNILLCMTVCACLRDV